MPRAETWETCLPLGREGDSVWLNDLFLQIQVTQVPWLLLIHSTGYKCQKDKPKEKLWSKYFTVDRQHEFK